MKLFYGVITLLITTTVQAAEPLYLYRNDQGVPVYSDRLPDKTENYLKKSHIQIETVKWKKTPKLSKLSSAKYKRAKKSRKSKSPDKNDRDDGYRICDRLERRIDKIEKELKRGQPPAQFDKFKQELADLRWTRRNSC